MIPEPVRKDPSSWSVEDAVDLYQIQHWGQGYFGVNAAGHMVVHPDASPRSEIDLHEVIEGLRARDLVPPVLLRFPDIVTHRLHRLQAAFAAAIEENHYRGQYVAVYPIKANQQRLVVEQVLRASKSLECGLEAGSKPELLAVLGLTAHTPNRLIICNGFKDEGYLKAVLLATKLGRTIIPVVENFLELRVILKYAERYEVRPHIGVRVKLTNPGSGRWGGSTGARAKFGLSVSEVIDMFSLLTARGMESCLELVHCHPGSQIQDISTVKDAMNELGNVYAELARMGAGLKYIDVGGGLGVDYSGSQSNAESSVNYTLDEYARDVVYRIASVCEQKGVSHPTIITESGRAMVAHHSVLLFNVLGSSSPARFEAPPTLPPGGDQTPRPILDLFDAYEGVAENRLGECYHDAVQARRQVLESFNLGYMTLPQRALAERLFWGICFKIQEICKRIEEVPEALRDLEVLLSDTYFGNLSVFQSLPDAWAIDQMFPIVPIHRLDEKPSCKAVLVDLTCDSDGKIDRFISVDGPSPTLDLHTLDPDKEYYLGAFLVGAYQETLGDVHNLFGDTHVVQITCEDGDWRIDEVVRGDTASKVLSYVQYDVQRLHPELLRECEQAVRDRRMNLAESQALLRFYESELNGYTYLESEAD